MRLSNEIQALGVQIAEQTRRRLESPDEEAPPLTAEAACASEAPAQWHDADAFLKAVASSQTI